MTDLTAHEAWDQIRERLSPEERLRFDMGQDVTVEMTREEYDAIENDPLRLLLNDAADRMGRALDRAILHGAGQPPVPSTFSAHVTP